jgi:hypothetical protein
MSDEYNEPQNLEEQPEERRKKEFVVITRQMLEESLLLQKENNLLVGLQGAEITVTEVQSKTQAWQTGANRSSEQALNSGEGLFTTAGKTFQVDFAKEDGSTATATITTVKINGVATPAIYSNDPEAALALAKASGWKMLGIPEEHPQAKEMIKLCQDEGFPYAVRDKSGEVIEESSRAASP